MIKVNEESNIRIYPNREKVQRKHIIYATCHTEDFRSVRD